MAIEGAGKYDLPNRSELSSAIEMILAVVFTILAIFGNTLIIAAFCKNKSLRTVPNLLVVNLAIVDTLAAISTHPLFVSVLIHGGWFLGHEACKYQAILNVFLFIISHLSITMLSLNRYLIIVGYRKRTVLFTKRSTYIFLVAIWVVSSCLGLSQLMAKEKFEFHANEAVCAISGRENSRTSILTAVFGNIVFIATVCLNIAIFKSIRLHRRQVSFTLNETALQVNSETGRSEGDGKSNLTRRRRRVVIQNKDVYIARKILIVTSLYTLCWLPQGILKNASFGNTHFPREVWMTSTFSMQFSSLLNPFLYGLLNRKFRKAILGMLGIRNRRNALHDDRNTSRVPATRVVNLRLGNLRSTTKETTTTSFDRARTGTRTSFSWVK